MLPLQLFPMDGGLASWHIFDDRSWETWNGVLVLWHGLFSRPRRLARPTQQACCRQHRTHTHWRFLPSVIDMSELAQGSEDTRCRRLISSVFRSVMCDHQGANLHLTPELLLADAR